MHASLLLGMMMVGGVIYPTESEITTIPLGNDLAATTFIQDQEYTGRKLVEIGDRVPASVTAIQDQQAKERAPRLVLPKIPTIDDDPRQRLDDMRRQAGYRSGPGGYPNPMYPNPAYQNPAQPRAMPQSPTEAGQSTGMGQAGGFTRPAAIGQPGAGFGQAPLPGGSFQPNTLTNSYPN